MPQRPHHPSGDYDGHRHSGSGGLRISRRTILQTLIGACIVAAVTWNIHRLQVHLLDIPGGSLALSCRASLREAGLQLESAARSLRFTHTYTAQRHSLYNAMGNDLKSKGLSIGGIITQGLPQSDLFQITDQASHSRQIKAVLRPLDVPVRAVIMPISDRIVAEKLRQATIQYILPAVPEAAVWLQNHSIYHSTIYHASTHMKPVYADDEAIQMEGEAVQAVTAALCPVMAILERVIATSSGVVIACWQVLPSGTEVSELRDALRDVLVHAPPPESQVVKQNVIHHTTLARLLRPPSESAPSLDATQRLSAAVDEMSRQLCGLQVELSQLLLVEEFDLLALALNGRFKVHAEATFKCPEWQRRGL